jgi:hypothetical protein
MLHGCQQTAEEFADGTRMNAVADRQGFAVLYPRQSLRANVHRCWRWYDARTQAGEGEARAIVAQFKALNPLIADAAPIVSTTALPDSDSGAPFHSGKGPQASDLVGDLFLQHRRPLPG